MLLSSPLLIVTTIWLHFANKGAGAWFLQERPGLHGKLFKIIKFKTMTDERDAEGNLLPDEARLTKIGKIVRKTSLDELPQLINVLKGDMALIGPRPLLPQYLPLYSPEQLAGMRFALASQAGRSVMDVMVLAGRRSSNWTSGMWIMCR